MSNHRYSLEFRDEAVRQIIDAGHSVLDVLGLCCGPRSVSSHCVFGLGATS